MALAKAAPARAAANFDRVARLYRWAEYLCLGPLLRRVRLHFLSTLTGRRRAVLLGDGDGRFTAALLRRVPALHALAVDSSASMLTLLRNRGRFAGGRLTTAQALLPALPEGALREVDLVVAHFVLDCLQQPELEALTARVGNGVGVGTCWLVSDFGLPARQPWRWLGRLYVGLLYRAFAVLTGLQARQLPDIEGALQRGGFTRTDRKTWLGGLLYSELWTRGPGRPAGAGHLEQPASPVSGAR